MKRKLFTKLFAGLLLLGLAFGAASCSSDTRDIEETQWKIENFTVKDSEWNWSDKELRWEATKQLPVIDEFIYENGALVGYIFFGQQGVNEMQAQLPYILNKVDNEGNAYEETIGYEFNYLTKRITFFIQDSQSLRDEAAAATYNFRIAMIW